MRQGLVIASAIACILVMPSITISDQKTNQNIYTDNEKKQLEVCFSMADVSRHVASEKKKGVPAEKVKAHFAGRLNSIVDKVYEEQSANVWDYAMTVFDDCTQNFAKVSPSRASRAHQCMADQFMVDVTMTYKKEGVSKEKVYPLFKKGNSDSPKRIIDKVYANSKSRADLKFDIWNECIDGKLE